MSSPGEDDSDFFNPSLLNDDVGQGGSFDDLDDRLAKKLSINEYDDDKNDETFGDEVVDDDDGSFFISNNDASDLVRGSRPYYAHQEEDWTGKKGFLSNTNTSPGANTQSLSHAGIPSTQQHSLHQQNHSLFGSSTSQVGSVGIGFHNTNTATNTAVNSSLNTSGSSTTGSGFGIPIGHSPSSPSNYIPGGGSSHNHSGSFGSFGSNNSGSFGSFTHQPVISPRNGANILLGSPSSTSPSGSFLSNILGASPNGSNVMSAGGIHQSPPPSSIIGGGQHHRQGSNNGGGSLWGSSSVDNQNDDAFLGSFFGGSNNGSIPSGTAVGTHHHTTSGSSTKQSTGLHFITDLISEEDEDDKSSGSGRSSTHQLSSGANSPFGFVNTEVNATIAPNSRIPLSGGLEALEFLPTVAHKHPELVKGEKPQTASTTTTTTTTGTSTTSTNTAQQPATPSYLMVKYNTYNNEDKTDCYNVINKVVVNEVLNKIPTPQDQRNKFHRFNNNNRSHNNNNNNSEKPHRIIQFMRIDEVETIIRQQMVDLQVHNGYSDDYYYFVKNNNTEQTIDLINKHLSEEEEERENAKQATSNPQGVNSTATPPARLFGRIPSQNVRTPRTCFDTNVFRDEVIDQYYKHKRIPSELRTRLIYNNPIQVRTCIENGLTLLIEISEFQTVAQHSKDISPKVAESFNITCQTIGSYLLYYQEIWNIPKGKKFLCKCLTTLPQPINSKLLIDMVPILIAEHSTNPQLLESMIKSLNSTVSVGTITMILVQLMRNPLSSIEFLNALLNRAITALSPKYQQQQMMHLPLWYQTFIQQFVPYFMSYYHSLIPDILYPTLSNILKLIPRNLPQFHHILFHIANDPNNHPLKSQLIQHYIQPTFQ